MILHFYNTVIILDKSIFIDNRQSSIISRKEFKISKFLTQRIRWVADANKLWKLNFNFFFILFISFLSFCAFQLLYIIIFLIIFFLELLKK